MGYWKGKRVLVTGGTGFLGRHVVEKLREAESHVQVVLHRDYDLAREEAVASLFSGPAAGVDVVIHLAGLVGGIGANAARPADYFYQNLMMGVLTMHYAFRAGVSKFVAAGAGCGYPERAPMPLVEDSFWDGFPQAESAPYSLAKRMLHVQSIAYWRQHRFPAIVTIPGNIYGPYDNFDLEDGHVVPALVRRFVEAVEAGADRLILWGTGRPTRDFVYAADVAEGLLRAGEVYEEPALVNLASGREASIAEVARALAEITGFRGDVVWDPDRPHGQARRCFDVGKARRDLAWEPRTPLRAGLAATVAWYREHGRGV